MKKLMILGAGTYQVPLIQTAKRMGIYTIVVSIPGDYQGFALADKIYELDTRDREGILAAARAEQIDGICTSGTDVAVATIGYVCEKMGLSGIPLPAAEILTDKAKMKEAFLAGGVCVSPGKRVTSLTELQTAAEELGYPVVVKCVNSSGSRGITVVKDASQLQAAYDHAREKSTKEYILVEGFIRGFEIGVDGFVQDNKLVFFAPHDKFIYRGSCITVPVGHEFPYRCPESVNREIERQIQLAVTAAGADQCSINADVFVNGETVSIIEMGGRTGATCIPELISIYYGFDFYEKMIRSALGEKVTFEHQEPKACMAKLLMSPVEGIITDIDWEGIEAVVRLGAQVVIDFSVGHAVFAMSDGTDRIGHVIAQTDEESYLDELVSRVRKCIFINGKALEEIWKS